MNIEDFALMVRQVEAEESVKMTRPLYANGMSEGVRNYLLSLEDESAMEAAANDAALEIEKIISKIV